MSPVRISPGFLRLGVPVSNVNQIHAPPESVMLAALLRSDNTYVETQAYGLNTTVPTNHAVAVAN
jgi:hypothetical protein